MNPIILSDRFVEALKDAGIIPDFRRVARAIRRGDRLPVGPVRWAVVVTK